jgi:hypothetical protein
MFAREAFTRPSSYEYDQATKQACEATVAVGVAWFLTGGDKLRSDWKRNGRPGGYRTAHFRNCRF